MELVILIAGVVAVVSAAVFLLKSFRIQYIIVANGTQHAIFVTVEHDKLPKGNNYSLIEAGESLKFTVSDSIPVTIRVKRCSKSTYDSEVCDYDYRKRGRQLLVI